MHVRSIILKVWRHIKNPTASIAVHLGLYLKNNRAKFHPNLIWNDGALGFLKRLSNNNNNNNAYTPEYTITDINMFVVYIKENCGPFLTLTQ